MTLDKDTFADQVKTLARGLWKPRDDAGGMCLFYSAASLLMFQQLGIPVCLQAGSMSWPIVRIEEDDGISPTHFSYVWEGLTKTNLTRLNQGLLPEIHIWVTIPSEGQLVDFSTGELKEQANRMGFRWTSPDPPKYLWDTTIPSDVQYKPDGVATCVALQLVRTLLVKV